jgi:cytochrome b6-f complex iron-sulfur subunit
MDRKEFFSQMGIGAAAILIPACLVGLTGCKKSDVSAPTNVDFTLDISTGALATNGGYLIHNGVLVARTLSGNFIAVSAACTHEGTSINYYATTNNFICPNHGARFDNNGTVTQGPANKNLAKYNTTLSGNNLRVYS